MGRTRGATARPSVVSGMDTPPRAYCSMRIIFMGLGIAKGHQHSIPQELSDAPIVALDNFSRSIYSRL
jgi:hypothetical protein